MTESFASDRWREIDRLFDQALRLEPEEWPAFLDDCCGADRTLQQELSRLLDVEARSRNFLSGSAAMSLHDVLAEALGVDSLDRIGEQVGPWRIVRRLGRGGMAGVFLGERSDGEFEQTVAIKFIRRGLDSEDFVRRFRAERQILSSFHHPNIAGLIGGGATESGRPYLVLEYVDGVSITDYCDEHRCSVVERLQLFGEVARAVQYAHTNLVVHRDIKPSNILVTSDGQVKLLDFGIAKLLDPAADPAAASSLTRTNFRPLTPEYASPEQVRGDPITTASDVYQLGVLLYRLLTGERPYRVTGTGAALQEAITGTQPPAPSRAALLIEAEEAALKGSTPGRLSGRLRGDLDVIILKALRKDPARRYGSALEMAEDVRRHLEGRPIVARGESRAYRVGKFLRRNAWVTPVAAVVCLLLGLYLVTLIRHGSQLEEERNVARDVQEAFVGFFTAPEPGDGIGLGEGRRDLTVREAILEGSDRVREDLADRPTARAELFAAMAAVLTDLDERGPAYELAREALALQEGLHGPSSPQVHETLRLVGDLTPNLDSARALLERRLELGRSLYGPNHPEIARTLEYMALTEDRVGNFEEATALLEESARIHRVAGSVDAQGLAWTLGRLAENQLRLGRPAEAVASSREAYAIMAEARGPGHSSSAVQGVKLATALRSTGEVDEARRIFESSLAILDVELGPSHGTTLGSRNNYALLLLQIEDHPAAEAVQRELLEAHRDRYGEESPSVADALQNLAVNLKNQGRYAEADSLLETAHRIYLRTRGAEYFRTAYPLLTLSEIRLIRSDFQGAETAAREATLILRSALPEGHFAIAVGECRLGRALAGQGERARALELLEAAEEVLEPFDDAGIADYREECLAALTTLQPS